MRRVAIIGGGISGLSTAFFLKRKADEKGIDLSYTLIEKNNRVGGNILTERIDGFVIEGGPDCFLSEKPWALKLCETLGLKDRLLPTNKDSKTYVLWKGRLHPLPEGFILMIPTKIMPFIFSPLISIPGKIRMALDLILPRGIDKGDESLGEFVRRRLGQEALDKIAEPLVAGVHAGDPETMSLKSSFPKFYEMEQEYRSLIIAMLKRKRMMDNMKKDPSTQQTRRTMFMTLKGGLSELIDAIVNRLDRESLLIGNGVSRIVEELGGYRIKLDGGGSIRCDSIVFATPAYVTASLVKGIDPVLSNLLSQIPYVSTATVSIGFKKEALKKPLKGFGFVVPRFEKRRIMAATWTSRKFAHRAPEDSILIRCFVGGSKNEELVSLGDDEMIEMVRSEIEDITGISAEPVLTRVFRWWKAMPQYTIGHSERVAAIYERLKDHEGLYITGSAYNGIGISDSVHGGEIIADKILKGF